MANHEACELYIEQQIESGLEDGKTPYAIGKELSVWIARLFEVKIPRKTLEKRAERKKEKLPTNVGNQENPIKPDVNEEIKEIKREPAKDGTMRGGPRPGAGRKPKDEQLTWSCIDCGGVFTMEQKECNCLPCQTKHKPKPRQNLVEPAQSQTSSAMQFAVMAISQLERIQKDDPQRVGALLRVQDWIIKTLNNERTLT